jgi:hypothetical protein
MHLPIQVDFLTYIYILKEKCMALLISRVKDLIIGFL